MQDNQPEGSEGKLKGVSMRCHCGISEFKMLKIGKKGVLADRAVTYH